MSAFLLFPCDRVRCAWGHTKDCTESPRVHEKSSCISMAHLALLEPGLDFHWRSDELFSSGPSVGPAEQLLVPRLSWLCSHQLAVAGAAFLGADFGPGKG